MVRDAPELVRERIDAAMASRDLDAYLEAKKEELDMRRLAETPQHLLPEILSALKQINEKLERIMEVIEHEQN